MYDRARLTGLLKEMQHHLFNELAPFWQVRGVDKEHGGYLTYLDQDGNPTGETLKTLICQTRMIFSSSHAHRNNVGDGAFLPIAKQGVDFLIKHFWDDEHTGWFWTTEADGTPVNRSKLTYGQSFAIYALSEYTMASGDPRGLEMAEETLRCLKSLAFDEERGGFLEFMEEDWSLKKPGVYGGDRKSFDVHMHLMEAFTNLYAASGNPEHKADAEYVIDLIFKHIIHPEHGTGIAQFMLDWTPTPQILFRDVWGADRDADDGARPLNNTSFGHNVEFAWLFKQSIDVLGLDLEKYKPGMRKIFDHCLANGIDWNKGGVFCEGPHDGGPARERNKEFWQQAEVLIGLLDACLLFGEDKYLDAYENVHRFVMDVVVNHKVGEWWPLFDENNTLLWTHMAHAWKINYHTMRSAIQSEARLARLVAGAS